MLELDPLRRQYEIDLVVHCPVWSMPGRCSGRFVWIQRVSQLQILGAETGAAKIALSPMQGNYEDKTT
ncbi:hypothetical protein DPMN_096632 [Dreissena polymorpha]|uniref:Uncharacterized protein n=1 Tax=Dreissena polymorpha TaxID=45954 RepID=A0A9D4L935_DREPO|nr:hypothetical protein DPMN_096632 [Dreissena polymorpha]